MGVDGLLEQARSSWWVLFRTRILQLGDLSDKHLAVCAFSLGGVVMIPYVDNLAS